MKAGFGAAFAVLLGVGIAAIVQTYAWESSVAWIAHTFEVIGNLDAAVRQSKTLSAAAAALTTDFSPAAATNLRNQLGDLTIRAAEISRLTSDNPRQRDHSLTLSLLTASRASRFGQALATANDTATPVAIRTALDDDARSGDLARFEAIAALMQTEEHRLLEIRMERQRSIATRTRSLFEFAAALSFLLTLLAALRSLADDRRRIAAERTLALREEQYRQVVEMAGDMIFRTDLNGRFTFCNETAFMMLHLTSREILGRSWLKMLRADRRKLAQRFYLRQFAASRQHTYLELPIIDGHGRERWIGQNVQIIFENGKITGFQGIAREITERRRAEMELQKSRAFVERIAATTPGILYVYDLDLGKTVFSNREVVTVLGYKEQDGDCLPCDPALLFHPEDLPALRAHHASLRLALDGEIRRIEYRARHAEGHWVWLAARDTPFERAPDGVVKLIVGIAQDITARKAAQEQLTYFANHDALTGLANRRSFSTRLDAILRRARLDDGTVSVCILDLDDFKLTNDRYGHSTGDEVLETLGKIITQELGLKHLAGRLGGDEFCFVLADQDLDAAAALAERIRARLHTVPFGTQPFHVTATFGVAEWRPPMSARELLDTADRALYTAKSAGRNQVCAAVA